eukprot:TRINITY_DN49027_c0_g1_i3.p2 TRINITY_DN49027_c0_g1~~TRINITY_DN49027_c0_g1_i3.p2  ORF type:complete len:383 (+),score=170.77 TRINITY_DN49027_c0_g1_i3:1468-2616(+)
MTAELSTMMSSNGGYIVWVQRAFGPFWGFFNAYNSVACNAVDLSLYPILFVQFVNDLHPLATHTKVLVFAAVIVLVFALNMRSLDIVGLASVVFTLLVLSPFIAEAFMEVPRMRPQAWFEVLPASAINYTLFINTMLWNWSGFDGAGSIAGEVKNPGRSYPIGVLLGIFLITINYVVPVAIGASRTAPHWDLWVEGYLITIAKHVAPWLGTWTLVASCMSQLGQYNANLSTTSRAVWRVGSYRMLPPVFATIYRKYDVPVVGVVFQTVCVCCLVVFDFEIIVQFSNFLNCITLLLEFAAFIVLKYNEPHAPRPYEVPGGKLGAWIITVPKIILIVATLAVASRITWILCAAFQVFTIVMYVLWKRGLLSYVVQGWAPVPESP